MIDPGIPGAVKPAMIPQQSPVARVRRIPVPDGRSVVIPVISQQTRPVAWVRYWMENRIACTNGPDHQAFFFTQPWVLTGDSGEQLDDSRPSPPGWIVGVMTVLRKAT
jgi:hypothetical protein